MPAAGMQKGGTTRRRNPSLEAPIGAPAWMVTYSDMVTLLLTFFVLLLSMSQVKEDQLMIEFMQAVKEAFGYTGGARQIPTEEVEVPKNIEEMTALIMSISPADLGYTNDEGPRGKRHTVETIRPGDQYQPGGQFHFASLSAELSPAEIAAVAAYARELRGHATLIKVRGHCHKLPVDGTPFASHMDLSIQRARTVAGILVENGVDPQRIHIIGAGTTQPITRSAYDVAEQQRNDIVELLQADETMDDLQAE